MIDINDLNKVYKNKLSFLTPLIYFILIILFCILLFTNQNFYNFEKNISNFFNIIIFGIAFLIILIIPAILIFISNKTSYIGRIIYYLYFTLFIMFSITIKFIDIKYYSNLYYLYSILLLVMVFMKRFTYKILIDINTDNNNTIYEKKKFFNSVNISIFIISILFCFGTLLFGKLVLNNYFKQNSTIAISNIKNNSKYQIEVVTEYINIRDNHNTNSEILGKVSKNDIYNVLKEYKTDYAVWYKIKTNNGITGWISNGNGKYIKIYNIPKKMED